LLAGDAEVRVFENEFDEEAEALAGAFDVDADTEALEIIVDDDALDEFMLGLEDVIFGLISREGSANSGRRWRFVLSNLA
jgi:hypothetical protein